jgi:hypothetical protein
MAEKEYTDEQIKELDSFFGKEANYNSYRELVGEDNKDYKDLFEPLEFARLFNTQVNLVRSYSNSPFTISQRLQKLALTDMQLFFLCEKLIEHFEIYDDFDDYEPQYEIVCRELSRLKEKLNLFHDKETTNVKPSKKFDFEKVKRTLKDISNPYYQIAYLIKIKTRYLQENDSDKESGVTFAQKCDFEIEKIEKIKKALALYATEQDEDDEPSDNDETVEDGNQIRNRDLTLDQAILFFTYLFEFTNVNCPNTKKAKVIATLTGFSENTINQRLSVINKKEVDNPKAFSKDIKKVRSSFEQLNFREITSMIDKDLSFK